MTGGALFDFQNSRITNARFMAPATAAELVARWRKSGLSTFMYTLNADTGMLEVYHIGPMSEREQQFVDERIHTPHKRFFIPPNGDSELPSDLSNVMLFFGLQPTEPARKFYSETIAEVQNIVPQIYHDIFGKEIAEVEFFPKDVSKASALEKLASDLYADRLIVFGDNINDIPMMRLADEAIAVENAVDEVKAIATDIIGHHNTDAVAKFINHHA